MPQKKIETQELNFVNKFQINVFFFIQIKTTFGDVLKPKSKIHKT
jgi:hypothetical protein